MIFFSQRSARAAVGGAPQPPEPPPQRRSAQERAAAGAARVVLDLLRVDRLGRAARPGAAVERAARSAAAACRPITWCWEARNEKSTAWRAVCSASAAHASSHTGSPVRLAPIARPANTTYSFVRSKIESSQAPSLENWRV